MLPTLVIQAWLADLHLAWHNPSCLDPHHSCQRPAAPHTSFAPLESASKPSSSSSKRSRPYTEADKSSAYKRARTQQVQLQPQCRQRKRAPLGILDRNSIIEPLRLNIMDGGSKRRYPVRGKERTAIQMQDTRTVGDRPSMRSLKKKVAGLGTIE